MVLLITLMAMLASASICRGAFYGRHAGRFLTIEGDLNYRTDLPVDATFEYVMSAPGEWVSQAQKPFPLTKDPVNFWAKFDLPSVTEAKSVLIDSSPWERIEFFFLRDGRLISHQLAGTLVPPDKRSVHVTMTPLFSHSGFSTVELLPNTRVTVFAHIITKQRYSTIHWLRFYVWDAEEVFAGERRDRLFQGIYLGIILFLVIYNLGLFFVIHELSYLYYVILELAGAVFWSGIFYGLTAEYLWARHPLVEYAVPWIAFGLSSFAAGQFFRHFLDIPRFSPTADRVVKWTAFTALGFFLVPVLFLLSPGLTDYGQAIIGIWVIAAIGVLVGVIILAWHRKHPLVGNVVIAMGSSAVGAFVGAAAIFNVLRSNDLTLHAPQIGSCIAGIILSIGLGFRLRNLETELADKQLEEARSQSAHEREKRELIEKQSQALEAKVRERTAELAAAQEKSDALLANILPNAVINELKAKGKTEPRRYDEVSILFSDFAGFTQAVATIPPKRLVQELDEIFREFDSIILEHGLEKIKTIGDAYMAAAGLPVEADDHAIRCVRAALALTQWIERRNQTSAIKWGLRVGVHSGTVVAGIVGKHKYAYDVWGDTVNIASRLESASDVNRVNISAYTYEQVRDHFDCQYRGKLAARGKGDMDMYFVVSERAGPETKTAPGWEDDRQRV